MLNNFIHRLKGKIFPVLINIGDPVIPKSKNVWIITGKNINGLFGNPLYLLDYIERENNKHKAFCLYGNDIFTDSKKISVLKPGTLKGLWILMRSSVVFISHGTSDIYWKELLRNRKRLIVNLWHGAIFKNIGINAPELKEDEPIEYKNKEYLRYDFFIVSSELEREKISNSYQIPIDRVLVTGLPRNDMFFENGFTLGSGNSLLEDLTKKNKKIILYAPTFRDYEEKDGYLQCLPDFNFKELEELLKKYDSIFLVRKHINDKEFPGFPQSEYIYHVGADILNDIQQLLEITNILMTDYSSIFIDYLLLNRPVISIKADIDRYMQKRGFAYDYEKTFPGAKVNTFKECIKCLDVYLKNPLEHQELRQNIKNRFHKYSEGGACERIVGLVEKRINNG